MEDEACLDEPSCGGLWGFEQVREGSWRFIGVHRGEIYKTLDGFNTINYSFNGSTSAEKVSS